MTFLMDPRVITLPWILRWPLVKLIVRRRHRQTAQAYAAIWTAEGSPLIQHSTALQKALSACLPSSHHVRLSLRYGTPSIADGLSDLLAQGCDKIIVLPLYPQFSAATTASTYTEVFHFFQHRHSLPELLFINDFYEASWFIKPAASLVQTAMAEQAWDHVLFSFHGLPVKQSNCQNYCGTCPCPPTNEHNRYCYRSQCFATARTLAAACQLPPEQWSVGFQSRLGKLPWITPYTDQTLSTLIQSGVKNLLVACPSFICDCLETLEEIGIRLKESWKNLGGENLTLVPCVNDHESWISALKGFIMNQDNYPEVIDEYQRKDPTATC